MIQKPLVSILMIVYNSYDFVRSENNDLLQIAINSLLNQSYKDIELIILDNQSSDDTPKICRKYEKNDKRVKFIVDNKKRFPEGSTEENFKNANGKYIMFANDDDIWDKHYIESLVIELENNPKVDIIYPNGYYIDVKGKKIGKLINSYNNTYNTISHPFSNYCKYITNRNPIPIIFGMYKKEAFKKSLPFEDFDNLKANVDNLYFSNIFLKKINCQFYNKDLFFYRVKKRSLNPTKIVGMPTIDKPAEILIYYINHQFLFYNELIKRIEQNVLDEIVKIYLKNITLASFFKFSQNIADWVCFEVTQKFEDKKFISQLLLKLKLEIDQEINDLLNRDDFNFLDLHNVRFDNYVQIDCINHLKSILNKFLNFLFNLKSLIGNNEYLEILTQSLNNENIILNNYIKILSIKNINNSLEINKRNEDIETSIISCSYNLNRFIDSTVKSIAIQKYLKLEHIIVDGLSTDGSIETLKKINNIVLISEKDSGYPEAFWKGLKISKGKYIIQCAISDCLANENWVKSASDFLDQNPNISLVWGLPQYIDEDDKLGKVSFSQFHYKNAPSKLDFFYYWLVSSFIYPEGNLCVRKTVIENCYPHFDKIKKDELDWLTFNFNFNSKGYLSHFIPQVANLGRTHGDQLSGVLDKEGTMEKMWNNYAKNVKKLRYKILFGLHTPKFIDSNGKPIILEHNYIRFIIHFFKHFYKKIYFKFNLNRYKINIYYNIKLLKHKVKSLIK